jgi:hypothetical protein
MSQSPQRAGNRRASYRRRSRQDVHVRCVRGAAGVGPNVAVSLLDASQTGIRLVVREVLERGEDVFLSLQGPADIAAERRGEVIWSVVGVDGSCCVGVRLQERLPYAFLIRLTEL